jgi:DNA processing protein
MSHLFALLCLSSVPGLGPVRIRSLMTAFGSAQAVLRSAPEKLAAVSGIQPRLARLIPRHRGESFARAQLGMARRHGVRIITLWDPAYPETLKAIHDPPVLLYVRGTIPGSMSVAVVGTRRPSPYGAAVAEWCARALGSQGITVVSGLARGIDTIAHRAALASGGTTIAVVGSGLDVAYPPENAPLIDAIARQGAVVSEFPIGERPVASHFPRRNRIISGVSSGCIIVESGHRGGAMITASLALDQHRKVFAIPGNITQPTSAGPNALIRDGRAKLVHSVDDVLGELERARTPVHR